MYPQHCLLISMLNNNNHIVIDNDSVEKLQNIVYSVFLYVDLDLLVVLNIMYNTLVTLSLNQTPILQRWASDKATLN